MGLNDTILLDVKLLCGIACPDYFTVEYEFHWRAHAEPLELFSPLHEGIKQLLQWAPLANAQLHRCFPCVALDLDYDLVQLRI